MIKDLFCNLVTIPSPSGDEFLISKFVEKELLDLGFDVCIDNEGNILARSSGKGVPVLLSGHLDTVQGNTKVIPVVKDGVVRSYGKTILGGDNKASVAAILTSLKRVEKKKRKNLEIVMSVREETDGGVSRIDLSWIKSKTGISADSGEPIGTIISDTPFIEGFQIRVMGKSSHSSVPEKGINALSIASYAISQFKWGKIDEFTTVNIGLIEGGSAVNTTPGEIILTGEIRSYIKVNLQTVKQALEDVFKSSATVLKGKVKFQYFFYCDGYSSADMKVASVEIRKVYKKLNIKGKFLKSFGGSDANFFNKHGIRIVDIGDGVYNTHTNNEYISIKDLNKLTDIFTSYITA